MPALLPFNLQPKQATNIMVVTLRRGADLIYQQANSVRSFTGVDPAIIATIASTETGNSLGTEGGLNTLGITTQAPSGRGTSGMSWGTGTPGAVAAGQPGAFWAYSSGAESAQAFANYIRNGPLSDAAPFLNNAQDFFQHLINVQSNYYVPMPGGQSKTSYYSNWQAVANAFTQTLGGGQTQPTDTTTPIETTTPTETQVQPTVGQQVTGTQGSNPSQPSTKTNLNMADSIQHTIIQFLLVLVGIALLLGGIYLLGSKR